MPDRVTTLLCLLLATPTTAATYYVAPRGSGSLSMSVNSPGALRYAVAYAPSGSRVILENGTYDGTPAGFTVANSGVTFRAQNWHGATVKNSTGANLWGPGPRAVNDICQGIIFGPCVTPTSGGWSGGGGDGWRFSDCEFTRNDGVGFGSKSLVLHCLFSDQWINSFDVNNVSGFTMRNSIVRRGNRSNADSDATGDKCDLAGQLTFDGLIAYDNEGPALWFDTDNKNWVVRNCTFFANHGGNNWYNLSVGGGTSATVFTGYGQDGEGISKGARLMAISGTAANLHRQTTVTAVSGYNPTTITVSPALLGPPAKGDDFAVQQGEAAPGYGLMSEANPNGSFLNNVTYNNTDAGFFDADSGDGYGVSHGGLTITGNQFDYDGIAFRSIDGGKGNPTRKLGPATIQHNKFKIGALTARNAFHWGGTNWLQGFPAPYYGEDFDQNTYDPDPGYTGTWADWYLWSGGPSKHYSAASLSDLQNTSTFNQDHHSRRGMVTFRGRTVSGYIWPAANDTNWDDIYHPNNTYSPRNSIHQVHDDETSYIQTAMTGKRAGQTVRLTVFGHTVFQGSGPYTCEVYDYSGRWMTLTLAGAADKKALEAAVPGYAVLNPSSITVKLTSDLATSPYNLTAIYRPGGRRTHR